MERFWKRNGLGARPLGPASLPEALTIPVQGIEVLVGHGEPRREVQPVSDDLDLLADSPAAALAGAASSSPSVVTLAVNQPRQPRAAGRAW
jgi:hypothetical protein